MREQLVLGELADIVNDKIVANKDPSLPYIGLENIDAITGCISGTQYSSASVSVNGVFVDGDVLYGKLRPNLRKVARADFKGYCSADILVLRAKAGKDPEYVWRVFQTESVSAWAERTAIGTKMPRTSWGALKIQEVFCPEIGQQEKIAQVLRVLDGAVRNTEALVAKLERVKQGMLADLLTRGIGPDGQLRAPPSEAAGHIEQASIGPVPRAWEVRNLGTMAEIVSGVTLGGSGPGLGAVTVPYLRVANVQDGFLDLSEIKFIRVSAADAERFRLADGDVLMNEGGDYDKLGRGTVWRNEIPDSIHQNHVFRVRTDLAILLPEFLAAYSASGGGKHYFVRSSKQSTNLASINSTQLKAFPIPVPPLAEQKAIIEQLATVEERLVREKELLQKLKLQKTALMDDLLTGRVRVTPLLAAEAVADVET